MEDLIADTTAKLYCMPTCIGSGTAHLLACHVAHQPTLSTTPFVQPLTV
jgi:hypothetical protein